MNIARPLERCGHRSLQAPEVPALEVIHLLDTNEMHLLGRDGNEDHVPPAGKLTVARRIVEAIARRMGSG
ncbi:MAG: hypothetical protein ACOC2D_05950 [Spirochaetota bacterium]